MNKRNDWNDLLFLANLFADLNKSINNEKNDYQIFLEEHFLSIIQKINKNIQWTWYKLFISNNNKPTFNSDDYNSLCFEPTQTYTKNVENDTYKLKLSIVYTYNEWINDSIVIELINTEDYPYNISKNEFISKIINKISSENIWKLIDEQINIWMIKDKSLKLLSDQEYEINKNILIEKITFDIRLLRRLAYKFFWYWDNINEDIIYELYANIE